MREREDFILFVSGTDLSLYDLDHGVLLGSFFL